MQCPGVFPDVGFWSTLSLKASDAIFTILATLEESKQWGDNEPNKHPFAVRITIHNVGRMQLDENLEKTVASLKHFKTKINQTYICAKK